MYFSFQSDSTVYNPDDAKFWAKFLTREWNVRQLDKQEVEPDEYFQKKYGITLDNNDLGIIIGVHIPDELYTLLLLKYENSI